MPEGHTLHRLADLLTGTFAGRRVSSTSPQGRFEAERFDGRVLVGAQTYGKHLFVCFDGAGGVDGVGGAGGVDGADSAGGAVHVHLGLYGSWRFTKQPDPPVVGQVRWRLADDATTADLRGPNTCEWLDPAQVDAVLARLGPDPLREDADPDAAAARILRSRAPIATLLMDQGVVAGVGNVYRAEVLFRAGLDPLTPGRELTADQWSALWRDLVGLMRRGVEVGRIDTVRPEHEPEAMGREPRVDDHGGEVYVYRRAAAPCHVCATPVRTTVLGGRNLFWCPSCQPPTST